MQLEEQPKVEHGTPTPRECHVLRLVAWGYSNKEIAACLGLAVKTVEGHKQRGMKRLNVSTGYEVVRYAVRQGWFQQEP